MKRIAQWVERSVCFLFLFACRASGGLFSCLRLLFLCVGLAFGGGHVFHFALLPALNALFAFAADLRIFCGALDAFRRNQTISAGADQILAASQPERFTHEGEVLRALELQQSALHGLFLRRARDEDGLAGSGIKSGMEHAG